MRDVKELEFGVGYVGDAPTSRWVDRARWLDAEDVAQVWMADERFYRDPWVLLTVMGTATSRIRVGTCVTDPFIRHPALTANAAATLDEATGGRVVLGMGAGVSGFQALGIERRSPATALRESTSLIRELLAGRLVDFHGKTVDFNSAKLSWPPDRVVPIYIAGRGPKILETGAEIGDGVIIGSFAGGRGLDYALGHVQKGAARRDPGLPPCRRVSWLYTCIDPDRAAAKEPVKRGIAVALWGSLPILDQIGLEIPDELVDYLRSTPYSLEPEVIGRAMAMLPPEMVEDFSLSGTSDDCAAKIAALAARDIDQISIWPFAAEDRDVDETVRRFVDEVIPLVRTA